MIVGDRVTAFSGETMTVISLGNNYNFTRPNAIVISDKNYYQFGYLLTPTLAGATQLKSCKEL